MLAFELIQAFCVDSTAFSARGMISSEIVFAWRAEVSASVCAATASPRNRLASASASWYFALAAAGSVAAVRSVHHRVRGRALLVGVGKYADVIEPDRRDEAFQLSKIVWAFTWKPGDERRPQRDAR